MARLSIAMLGPFQVTLDGRAVTAFETEKERALLAYLAMEAGRPHRREVLAELLWPGRPEGTARANLRHTLTHLRRAIGDAQAVPPFLLVTMDTIQLNLAGDVWVDVAAFAELRQGEARSEPLTAARLEEVVSLVRGAFLEDLSLADSAAFEEWAVVSRERLGRQILATLHNLTRAYEGLGEYERALYHAWHWVDLEPWDEGAQRQVMRLLALTGQRAAALAQYEACRCAQAASLLDEAIAAYQETAGLAARAKLYAVAASARGLLGCYDEARTLAHASLALARECGSRREAGICCLVLGFGATVERSFAAAQEWFEESAALLQGVGMQDVLGSTLAAWGYAARGLGQHARSWQLMAQALRMRSGGPFLGSVLVALPGIALLLLDRGEAERAAELCALAWRYPFVSRSPLFEDLAGREIAAAAIRLPPERVLAARSRGRARDLDATLSDLASETGF